MLKKIYNKLFAVDSVGYALLSAIAATLLLWGLCKGFVWLYNITPWWFKLVIAILFCYALYRQLRVDQAEEIKRNQEDPTDE